MIDKSINVKGNVRGSNLITGDNTTINSRVADDNDVERLVRQLLDSFDLIKGRVDKETADSLQEDMERFTVEALREKPSRKWLEFSSKGLIGTVKSLGEAGKPMLESTLLISKLLGLN